jgi:two-component system, OmpR family, response regulator
MVPAIRYLSFRLSVTPDCRIISSKLGICNLTRAAGFLDLHLLACGKGTGRSQVKILVIEDDAETADYVANGLREEGHLVTIAATGSEALAIAMEENLDLLIVDRMIPGLDGLRLVRALRAADRDMPVLFLTALGGVEDRVSGLNAGGDDYLVKPFAFSELVARVAALGRRPRTAVTETSLRVSDLEIDLLSRTARRRGESIDLQPREYRLLEYLMRHAGQVVTRTMLLEHVWDLHFDPRTNVVETHISRLRSKVDKGFGPELIHTVRGAGYCLRGPG